MPPHAAACAPAWMVTRITSLPVFVGAGIILPTAVVVILVAIFRRRGRLTADGTADLENYR